MQNAEYPIFAASWRNRIKGIGDGGLGATWWLLSVMAATPRASAVSTAGMPTGSGASTLPFTPPSASESQFSLESRPSLVGAGLPS